jgi:3-hydroxyacyl-CoA dehydrogenase
MDAAAPQQVTQVLVQSGVGVVTLNSPPVNALSVALRAALLADLTALEADGSVSAVVLIGAGRGFSGGADIKEFGKPFQAPGLDAVLALIEGLSKPVVAAIHGSTLGGGLETALACHYRVASRSAKVGLPEVKLGLLPGAGGTQRLPRLVGPQAALEMIVFGEPIGADAALRAGLVNAVAEDDKLLETAVAFARKLVADGAALLKVRDRYDKIAAFKNDPAVFETFKATHARRLRGQEAPAACIQAVQAAVDLPFDEGLALERNLFLKLVQGTQSAALRYAFFAERQAAKLADIEDDLPLLPIKTVGMIGAGTMGGGISMNFLSAGIPVTIVEMRAEALERGVATIRKNYEATAKKGRLTTDEVEARMARLTPTLDFSALADCDLIIEAVFELMEVKKEIFAKLDAIAKPGAILASNTSYLDIDEIASATSRPEAVIGMHFFSPANVMRLLEVVRGAKTAKPVIATAMALGKAIGKTAVLVGVCHGFVGNRMLAARQDEANKLILEGAMPWDVDRVLFDFGLPMGPFAMADLAGLDLGWVKERSTSSDIREILCEMDRWGQKKSAGFYDYDASRKASPSPVVEQVILDFSARQGIARRAVTDEEILERCLYPMINEGVKILEEGIASRASDIDVVWINGYGWPAYRGGPMFYADTVGLAHVVERLKAFEATHGAAFKPAALLEKLAAQRGTLATA